MTPQMFANALLAEHQAARGRERALANFYAAERNAGADPLTANERMHEFAKRLDYERDLSIIRKCLESK